MTRLIPLAVLALSACGPSPEAEADTLAERYTAAYESGASREELCIRAIDAADARLAARQVAKYEEWSSIVDRRCRGLFIAPVQPGPKL